VSFHRGDCYEKFDGQMIDRGSSNWVWERIEMVSLNELQS
jgi:hypothetical protein